AVAAGGGAWATASMAMNSEAIAQIAHETTLVNARRVSMSSSPVSLNAHSSTSDQAVSAPIHVFYRHPPSPRLRCAALATLHRSPRRSLPSVPVALVGKCSIPDV